ncbi:MAG: putative molybdenum carrier protein [Gammaproteobacteria bacterium]|nr:putative molybdenum carrier protein [Gammaproteobacteria bacterium]
MQYRESKQFPIRKIVSGGQSGADRAALDWAIANGIEHGGWCPSGRRAEDGEIESKYQLSETPSRSYLPRTKQNVCDSDGTLIVNSGMLDGGTLNTKRFAEKQKKPVIVAKVAVGIGIGQVEQICLWLQDYGIEVLNVAGPRESKRPGIYRQTFELLDRVFETQT